MNFFVENLYSVVFLPMWIFLIITLGKFFNVIQSRRVNSLVTMLGSFCGIIFALGALIFLVQNPNFTCEYSYSFLKIQDYSLNFGILVDNLSVLMLLLVCIISFIVQLYASSYMFNDKSFTRFFAYLNLFNFSMIGLILSSNLFQTYVFWELVGVSSYLLIGFWYKKPSASNAAKKAFIMNRIGDFGLLAGFLLVSYIMYQYSNIADLATVPFSNIADIGDYLYSFTNDVVFNIICILLLMGSIAKSAQFPLHTWLADAMEGPTPVSALIHSATMVAAGVFLIARLYPVFELSDFILEFICIIGAVTAIICGFFALTQNDLKRILAYSTSSQLGLMFLALGAGAYAGGLCHLVTHAYFKSMLFLCAGIVIHGISCNDIRFMGGLRKNYPVCAICYLVGCISISGLFFSGFYSKEMMLDGILAQKHFIYALIFLLTSLMTAFYMFRSYFLVFEGEQKINKELNQTPFIQNISISILAIFTVLVGYFIHKPFYEFIQNGSHAINSYAIYSVVISIVVAVIGITFAWWMYVSMLPKIKAPKFLYNLSFERLYIDDFYKFLADKIYLGFANSMSFVDKYIIDGLVFLSTLKARGNSWIFSKMQTGNFQSYFAYSVVFFAFIFTLLAMSFIIIMEFGLFGG